MDDLKKLMNYKQWANKLLYASLKDLPKKELIAKRPVVFGSIIRTLNHTFAMDLVWQAHLQNRSHDFKTRNPDDCPSFEHLIVEQEKLDQWYVSYTESISKEDEEQVISFTFIGGGEGVMSRREILLHIVNHATYHRGHVTGMMYQCSLVPPTTDYPIFLMEESVK